VSGGQNGGDLGMFSRGQMVALKMLRLVVKLVKLVDLVQTQFGYHLIQRTQ
jgi:parvulin-like peptidyl-prolyl isomerase